MRVLLNKFKKIQQSPRNGNTLAGILSCSKAVVKYRKILLHKDNKPEHQPAIQKYKTLFLRLSNSLENKAIKQSKKIIEVQ